MGAADELKTRLREDLQHAMRARNNAETKLLRSLIGAIDNAEAVDLGGMHEKYAVRAFGDRNGEVPRKNLSSEQLRAILLKERDERAAAALQIEEAGDLGSATMLRGEAQLVNRYLL